MTTTDPHTDRRGTARAAERGATLVGYSLVLAVMVVSALATLGSLVANSDAFLTNTGEQVGEARQPRDVLVTSTLPIPPDFGTSTVPSALNTYVDLPLMVKDSCLNRRAGDGALVGGPCDTERLLFSATSVDAITLTISIDGGADCLTARSSPHPKLFFSPCAEDRTDQQFLQISRSGSVSYESVAVPGKCLSIRLADPPEERSSHLWNCNNGHNKRVVIDA